MKHINHNYYILIYYFFRCRWFRAGVLPSPTSGATSPLPTSLLVSPTSRPSLAPPPPLCPASALRHQDQELVVHAGRHRARLSPGNFKRDFRPAIFLVSFSSKLIIGLRIFLFCRGPRIACTQEKGFFFTSTRLWIRILIQFICGRLRFFLTFGPYWYIQQKKGFFSLKRLLGHTVVYHQFKGPE